MGQVTPKQHTVRHLEKRKRARRQIFLIVIILTSLATPQILTGLSKIFSFQIPTLWFLTLSCISIIIGIAVYIKYKSFLSLKNIRNDKTINMAEQFFHQLNGWEKLPLETITAHEPKYPENLAQFWPTIQLQVGFAAAGTIGTLPAVFVYRQWSGVTSWVMELHIALDGAVPGHMMLEFTAIEDVVPKKISLESNEFNSYVALRAEPKSLGFELLSPELMEWYLYTSSHPRIYVEAEQIILIQEVGEFSGEEDIAIQELYNEGLVVAKKINDLVTTA